MADPKPEPIFAPIFHSERLVYTILQLDSEEDMEFVVNSFNTPPNGSGPTDGRWTAADVRRLSIGTMLKPGDTDGRIPMDPAVYLVHLGSTPGTRIGMFNLCRRTPEISVDFGFNVIPEYQQKGYGTEAGTRIMKYWTSEFGIKDICVVTGYQNIPAQKLSLKLGFVEGGWVSIFGNKVVCYVLPGMDKLDGQDFRFWGDAEPPTKKPLV